MLIDRVRNAFQVVGPLVLDERAEKRARLPDNEPERRALVAMLINMFSPTIGKLALSLNSPPMRPSMRLPREGVLAIATGNSCHVWRGTYGRGGSIFSRLGAIYPRGGVHRKGDFQALEEMASQSPVFATLDDGIFPDELLGLLRERKPTAHGLYTRTVTCPGILADCLQDWGIDFPWTEKSNTANLARFLADVILPPANLTLAR